MNSDSGFFRRLMGKCYSFFKGWPARNPAFAEVEIRYFRSIPKTAQLEGIYHILYYDSHYFFWEKWDKAPRNIIGTIHHPPPRRMNDRMLENLKRISSAVVLSSCDLSFYESHIGEGRVKVIRHGVDIDFFKPANKAAAGQRRLLFVGQNGRNTRMLERIIRELANRHPELFFDLLVRKERRNADGLYQLTNHPKVRWYENIPDESLRDLYRTSYLLLMPMESTSANNAVVEALACGLPVVATNVGGITDYGGGAIYPLVENEDDRAMIELIERYLAQPQWRDHIAGCCARFAEQYLTWSRVARQHLEAYGELAA